MKMSDFIPKGHSKLTTSLRENDVIKLPTCNILYLRQFPVADGVPKVVRLVVKAAAGCPVTVFTQEGKHAPRKLRQLEGETIIDLPHTEGLMTAAGAFMWRTRIQGVRYPSFVLALDRDVKIDIMKEKGIGIGHGGKGWRREKVGVINASWHKKTKRVVLNVDPARLIKAGYSMSEEFQCSVQMDGTKSITDTYTHFASVKASKRGTAHSLIAEHSMEAIVQASENMVVEKV